MLELKNICVSFRSERQDKVFGHTRQQVLFDVSLNVKRGTCLGILGESGSGKSTMGRVLCGLLKPDSGEAILDGVSVYASRAGRRNLQNKLSVVFQDYTTSANPRFRVKDIIGEGLTVRERRGALAGQKLCFVGDGSNMANSLIVGGLLSGMKVDCVCPHGYRPAADVLMFAHKYGSAFRLLEDPAEGVKDADVVVTAVWNTAAPGTSESESRLRDFAGFQLTSGLLKAAKPDCMVLHCLPAHRGEEISTAVFEAHADEIFTEAENRLHVQKAVLAVLLAGK